MIYWKVKNRTYTKFMIDSFLMINQLGGKDKFFDQSLKLATTEDIDRRSF